MTTLAENQVKLSDGRIVEMREQKGSDESIVALQLGELFTPDGAGAMVFQTCLIVRTIVSVGGTAITHTQLRNYADVRDFLDQFKGKDWNKIRALYMKLNGDAEGNDSESK